VENCLEAKELERQELQKSCEVVQSALRQADDEKSRLLLTLSEVKQERNGARDELRSLNETNASLHDQLFSSSNKCSLLEDWLQEVNSASDTHQLACQSRLESVEADKRQLLSRISQLELDVRNACCMLQIHARCSRDTPA